VASPEWKDFAREQEKKVIIETKICHSSLSFFPDFKPILLALDRVVKVKRGGSIKLNCDHQASANVLKVTRKWQFNGKVK